MLEEMDYFVFIKEIYSNLFNLFFQVFLSLGNIKNEEIKFQKEWFYNSSVYPRGFWTLPQNQQKFLDTFLSMKKTPSVEEVSFLFYNALFLL